MGKTGKWIKTLLLGKKTSKSNSSKGRDFLKSANKRETLVSSKVPMSGMIVDSPSILPVLVGTEAKNGVDAEKGVAAELTTDDGILSSANEDANSQTMSSLGDPERTRLEHAAIKAQAAFRGYAARRAFRTLKGIVRLQALIRGRLVRRQAVATLRCVWGIVKLQALARGQKDPKSFGINTCMKAENLRKKALCRKLLASSPTAMPLSLNCGSGEPNSAWEWLERWTMSRFWEPLSQPKKNLVSKPHKTEPVRPKRSVRKPSSANSENGSIRSTSVSEKPNRNLKKISSHSVGPVQEHPQNEIEKVKRNSRRFSNPTKEVSDELEHDNEKPKHSLRKAPSSTAHNVSEQGNSDSAEQMKDTAVEVLKRSDLETSEKLAAADGEVDELHKHPAADLQPMENNAEVENNQGMNELNSKVDHISNENLKTSKRRASLPTKIDHQENELHSTPRLPSYMAPTESAKARLRGQGSPKLVEDEVENNSVTRRHSLPSSTNGKLSSLSPRVQRLVQATGKGVIRSDRSLMSSRDGGDKVVQAEWRR